MNRFYKDVSTGPAFAGDGFVILLDQRPVRTPARAPLLSPTKTLAEAIAKEWAAQGEVIAADSMPLTQILTTTIDRAANRTAIEADILRYLDSDLLCYRAGEPKNLSAEQDRLWTPWLNWFEEKFGYELETTFGLSVLNQPQGAHDKVGAHVKNMDHYTFTAFQTAGALTGSIVLALAMVNGALAPQEAWNCALCEELFYERTHDLEKHGLDPIEEKRRAALKRDLDACAAYLKLIK